MGKLQTLTVKVEERRFYQMGIDDETVEYYRVPGPCFHFHDHEPLDEDPDARCAGYFGKTNVKWLGVHLDNDEIHALAVLSAELTEWLSERAGDVDVRLDMRGRDKPRLDVIFTDTNMSVAEPFVQFWNGREVVWNGASNIKFFD